MKIKNEQVKLVTEGEDSHTEVSKIEENIEESEQKTEF